MKPANRSNLQHRNATFKYFTFVFVFAVTAFSMLLLRCYKAYTRDYELESEEELGKKKNFFNTPLSGSELFFLTIHKLRKCEHFSHEKFGSMDKKQHYWTGL